MKKAPAVGWRFQRVVGKNKPSKQGFQQPV
jgi:hypothetical protein